MTSLSTCFVASYPLSLSLPSSFTLSPSLSHSPSTFAAPVFVCLFSLVIVFYAAFDVVDGSADSSDSEGQAARREGLRGRGVCWLHLILISVGRSPLGLVIMTCKYKMPCQAVPRRLLLQMRRMCLRIVGFSCCCCTVEVVAAAQLLLVVVVLLLWFCLRITSINFAGLICVLLPVALPAPHRSREALQANRAPRRPFVYAFSSSFIIFLLLFLFPLPTAIATCKRQQHHEKCIFNSRRDNVEDVVENQQQQQQ